MEIEKENKKQGKKTGKPKTKYVWLGTYAFIAAGCLCFYFLLRAEIIFLNNHFREAAMKWLLAGFFAVLILSLSKFLELMIMKRSHSRFKRYNLIRITHLAGLIAVAMLLVSFIFSNWYAAAVSLGLVSLILGFALQTPISSFIGWIYIVIRNPFRIGDRIQIDTFKGDVIEIGYLDTTLWEFAGDYLTNDLPSGRLIRFPNSLVLASPVYNYSWRNFRYIWNEIPFHVAYESDLDFVSKTIKEVTMEELGDKMQDRIEELKDLVKESPIDDLDIKEYPFVSLRINTNTWVEVTITYLVSPRQAASIRTKIIRRVLSALLSAPDKTLFPKSNAR